MGIYSEMKESIRRDLIDKLKDLKPFSLLDEETLCSWISDSKIEDKLPGENILRTDEINNNIYLVLQGEIRLIAFSALLLISSSSTPPSTYLLKTKSMKSF